MVTLASSPSPTAIAMPAEFTRPTAASNEVAHTPTVVMPTPTALAVPKKAEIAFDADKMMANMKEAVSRLNDMMESTGRGLNFAMDAKLGRPVVTVTNTRTGEVVRTIPNEVVIRVAHNIEDLKGVLYDQTL